jgi:hypothetical protein
VRRAVQRVAIVAGAAGFVWLVANAGVDKLWEGARALGAGTVLFVAFAGLEHLCHAWGWQRCFAPGHAPRLPALFDAYLAGYAFSFLTPTASVGGDVLRATLVPPSVPAVEAAASVTADRLACSVSDALFGLAGVCLLLASARLEAWHRVALVAATVVFGFGIGGFFLVQRSGWLAGWISTHPLVQRFGGERLAARLARAGADLDGRLRSLHLERPEAFRGALVRNLAASAVGGLQIAIFLAWLGEPHVVRGAAQIFLVGIALDIFSFFIPARLGVQEGSRMLGASIAGFDPSLGLLLSLVLRLDQMVWAGIGLAVHSRITTLRRPRREPV